MGHSFLGIHLKSHKPKHKFTFHTLFNKPTRKWFKGAGDTLINKVDSVGKTIGNIADNVTNPTTIIAVVIGAVVVLVLVQKYSKPQQAVRI